MSDNELSKIENVRQLAEHILERGGDASTILALHRVATSDGSHNRIGGVPRGIAEGKWPSFNGKPMTHMLTLDLASMPGFGAALGVEADACISFFLANPQSHEAWSAGNNCSATIVASAADVLDDSVVPSDVEVREEAHFIAEQLDVPSEVWGVDEALDEGEDVDEDLLALHEAVYDLDARVGGLPLRCPGSNDLDMMHGVPVMQVHARFLRQPGSDGADIKLGDWDVFFVSTSGGYMPAR